MDGADLEEYARELLLFLKGFENADILLGRFGESRVFTRNSACELYRTLEVQILEEEGVEIKVAAFSDGPDSSIGIGAVFNEKGFVLSGRPVLIVDGLPIREIAVDENL